MAEEHVMTWFAIHRIMPTLQTRFSSLTSVLRSFPSPRAAFSKEGSLFNRPQYVFQIQTCYKSPTELLANSEVDHQRAFSCRCYLF